MTDILAIDTHRRNLFTKGLHLQSRKTDPFREKSKKKQFWHPTKLLKSRKKKNGLEKEDIRK